MVAGTLYYLAVNTGAAPPYLPSDLILPTFGNFSGKLTLPSANNSASVTLCIADGGSFQLYGLSQVCRHLVLMSWWENDGFIEI